MSVLNSSSEDIPEVSVIVPLHRDGEIFRKCLSELIALNTEINYEVMVVSDKPMPTPLPNEVVALTTGIEGDSSPAVKRDFAAERSRGSILAFIDDDAYPASGWLDNAVAHFKSPEITSIGGPGETPPNSSALQRVGGAVYESRFGSGPLRFRFTPVGEARQVDDLPAYNFFVRKDALNSAGGWASDFYGGEDTKVCLALQENGNRLIYCPDVRVFHFRRKVLRPHMRQIGNVGRHRGFFVRRFPGNSRKFVYFLPALVIIIAALVTLIAFVFMPVPTAIAVVAIWLILSATAVKITGIVPSLVFPFALIMHHVSYGFNFLKGLFGPALER